MMDNTQTEAISNETQVLSNAERQAKFKANQAFKSLPLGVQHRIDRLSDSPEEKARRTANALDYQKKFPMSVHKGIDPDVDCRAPYGESCNCQRHARDEVEGHSMVLELCRTCGVGLPPLENLRQYPGMCIMCVTKKHRLKQQVSSQLVEVA